MAGSTSSKRPLAPAIFACGLIVALEALAIYQLQPPSVVPATAPAPDFSAARAMDHLRVIARKPHPTGSPENARVRAYLTGQLTALGLDPQVQTATGVRDESKWSGPAEAATVNNVMARLRGSHNTKAVMLAAHYDSVPTGPGASDDGSGTVTLLETARALKARPPLMNDVIFLFTDGEELGLLGAQAFADQHPWAKDAGVVLNFEARGACGPSIMFETSAGNGWLIGQFAKAAPYPVTSSFADEVYRRLPNDTDLTVFKRAGLAGLNFAYTGCWPRYHTQGDGVARLDQRSIQHDGSYALALARRFGNLDLSHLKAPDAVYFSLFGVTFHYPAAWVIPLTVALLVAFAAVVGFGFRRREITWRGLALGFLGWPAGAAVAVAGCYLLWRALRDTRFVSRLPYGMAYNSELYATAFVALTIALFSALYLWLLRRTGVGNLTVASLLWWLILAMVTGLLTPGVSYLFVWPLAAALAELAYIFAGRSSESEAAEALVWVFPAVVGILLFGTLPYLLLKLLSTSGIAPTLGCVALLLGLLTPHLHVMTAHRRKWLPLVSVAAGIVLVVAAMATSGFDAAHPRADSVFYAFDADSGSAVWASGDRSPDPWTSQFLTGRLEKADLRSFIPYRMPLIESRAQPVAGLTPTSVTATDDVTLGDDRLLRLSIVPPHGASALWITVQGAKVQEASINGQKSEAASPASGVLGRGLIYTAPPEAGIVLNLELKASDPLALKVVAVIPGLPEIGGAAFRPRPGDLMPSPMTPFDSSTLVVKTFRHLEMRM